MDRYRWKKIKNPQRQRSRTKCTSEWTGEVCRPEFCSSENYQGTMWTAKIVWTICCFSCCLYCVLSSTKYCTYRTYVASRKEFFFWTSFRHRPEGRRRCCMLLRCCTQYLLAYVLWVRKSSYEMLCHVLTALSSFHRPEGSRKINLSSYCKQYSRSLLFDFTSEDLLLFICWHNFFFISSEKIFVQHVCD